MPIFAGFAFGGSAAPVDHTIPAAPSTTGGYTITGTLLQTFTSSGTYTPGGGVTRVTVVVIGGGGNGGTNAGVNSWPECGAGGGGGGVRVYRNVPVSGSVSVTVGGAATASSFGALSAPGGLSGDQNIPGRSLNFLTSHGGGWAKAGQAGPVINGTAYAGGGGGGGIHPNLGGGYTLSPGAGGSGGGGGGGYDGGGAGTAGMGGGGGGTGHTSGSAGGAGGSGRVMIYSV